MTTRSPQFAPQAGISPDKATLRANAERQERIDAVGTAALEDARTSLMMAFRFLDAALWRMPIRAAQPSGTLATNGATLYLNGLECARFYRDMPAELTRDLLHTVLHCVFRHPFNKDHANIEAWHLACDLAVEATAMEMASVRFPSAYDEDRRTIASYFAQRCGTLNPNKTYSVIDQIMLVEDTLGTGAFSGRSITEVAQLFNRDDHVLWALPLNENDQNNEGGLASERSDNTEENDSTSADDSNEQNADQTDADDEEAWEKIAHKMESDLESFSKEYEEEAANLISLLKLANRRTVNYSDFLRRFAVIGEDMRINDDEFDYIFYTYGLKRYGNMPLIEPLEYVEDSRVREFVIAIDTSGSCEGALVRSFLTRTYEMLKNSEHFGSEVNVHVIQCDAEIQSDTKIESAADLAQYEETLEIRGLGGTDFRPVFDYVDKLIEQDEFTNLRGLIYFTDGEGTYPEKQPPYETAFVFMDDTAIPRRVPPWAMKVVIDSEGVRNLTAY